jgi:DNA-binding MarR family transcriptional regulator
MQSGASFADLSSNRRTAALSIAAASGVGGFALSKAGKAGGALRRSPVHLLHRALQHGLELYAEETGAKGVTQRQFAVLSAVAAEDGLSQTQLVRRTGIDRSTVAELVNRMTRQGLLARSRTENDARTNSVRLTDEGLAILRATEPLAARADRRLLKLLGAKKGEVFTDLLKELVKAAGVPAAEAAGVASKPARKSSDSASA